MTLRTKNKINFFLFIFSTFFFLFDLFLLFIKIRNHDFTILHNSSFTKSFLTFITEDNTYAILISAFFQLLYVSTTSFFLYRSFEKTQAFEMIYYFAFLASLILDTIRIWILVIDDISSYLRVLNYLGHIILFGRILAPLSLLFAVIFNFDLTMKKEYGKNLILIIISSLFFAILIPVNSTSLLSNYSVSFSYAKIIRNLTYAITFFCIITLLFNNYRQKTSPKNTISFSVMTIGYILVVSSSSILKLSLGCIFLSIGTYAYFREVHNYYLWND